MNTQRIIELLENADLEVRTDYSGRGMYGKTCVGVVLNNNSGSIAGFVASLMTQVVLDATILDEACNDVAALEEMFANTKEDSMGLSTILYFPQLRTDKE